MLADVRRGLRLDVAFARVADRLESRDRAFAHELLFGLVRLRGRLDHLLERRVHRGIASLDPVVLDLLRVGAYQLLYMESVPAYAAVSESVSSARDEAGGGAAGLVNAVLRSMARDGDGLDLFPDFDADPEGFLSTWGSHPRWLVARWLAHWPAEAVRCLVEADNRPPRLSLVPLEHDPAEATVRLGDAGIAAEPAGRGSRAVWLAPGTDPSAALSVLPSIIQDPGANLVARYAAPEEGMKVADLCAAPGGKTLALPGPLLYTVAADRSEARLRMVRENARRTGRRPGLVVADGRRPPVREVDMVLLDVPCTGTGTLGRHPDGRWRIRPGSVQEMATLQGELLEAVADRVHPGGLLVYSTCSLEPEENAAQVEAFLVRHPEFSMAATDTVPSELLDAHGRLSVLPQETGFDGAFAARMRRR